MLNVNAGDKVWVAQGGNPTGRPASVKRVTKTLIILDSDTRWSRKTGGRVGQGFSYHSMYLVPCSDARASNEMMQKFCGKNVRNLAYHMGKATNVEDAEKVSSQIAKTVALWRKVIAEGDAFNES